MSDNDTKLIFGDDILAGTRHVGLLLVPGFPMLPYACVVESIRAANRLSDRTLYRWSHISIAGHSSAASNGVDIRTQFSVGSDQRFDYVFVCAGGNPALFEHAPTFAWLRQLSRRGVSIGGVSGGTYLMVRAGLLNNYRCTIHWEHASALMEDHPTLDLRRSLFEIDRDRLTCSGGTAALDMMHEVITKEHGADLAHAISEWFLQTQVREGAAPHRMPLRERLGTANPHVLRVVEKMEEAIETPLTKPELAAVAGLSVRQLERLFRQHIGVSAHEFYLRLRLNRSRDLLRQSSLSVLEIALACGFASSSHYSRAYRARFGHSPRGERSDQISDYLKK